MNRLQIDFAPLTVRRELHRISPFTRWLIVAWVLLGILGIFRVHELLGRLDSLDRKTASLAATLDTNVRQPLVPPGTPIDARQGEAVNAAVARLNLPWADILDSLEIATPEQVSLLSIRPEPRRAQLRIEAQASRSEEMIGYLKALEQQPSVERAYLTKHERIRDGFAEVIRFQVEVQWRRAAS